MTLTLIDQSIPKDHDPQAPLAFTYRCDACGSQFRALTRARAEMHKCGVIAPENGTDEVAALRAQVEELKALVQQQAKAEPKPKRGRPKKAAEPAPA